MRTFMLAVTTGLVFGIAACSSYGTSVLEKVQARVASVSVALPLSLPAGQTARGTATLKDANGVSLANRPVAWFSSNAAIATVNDSGVISALAPGNAVVSAVSEGVAGQATMAVLPPTPTPIATISVAVTPSAVVVGQTARATATLKDAVGSPIVGRAITWQSSNASVANVTTAGDVAAVAPGTATITASSEGKSGSSALSVSAPSPVPVASVVVSPATASLLAGGTVQLSAATLDASGAAVTGRQINWSSNNSAVSTVSASGLVTAVGVGGATITATSEAKIGTSAITVTGPPPPPPPLPGSRCGNQASGMTLLDERPFNTLTENAAPHVPRWDTDVTLSIVTDATAPQSPPNVIRATYPPGFGGGGAPGHAGVVHPAFAKIYICFAMKLSSNWVGNGSGVNKVAIEWTANPANPSFVFSATGVGSATLVPQIRLQNIVTFPGGIGNLDPNLVPTAQIIRGQWQQIEVYIQGNSAGSANGTIDWYVDGVHVGSVGGIGWTTAATTFNIFEFQPIWGGTSNAIPITATQTMDWDNVYFSGKN